jgi:hypothetical protein
MSDYIRYESAPALFRPGDLLALNWSQRYEYNVGLSTKLYLNRIDWAVVQFNVDEDLSIRYCFERASALVIDGPWRVIGHAHKARYSILVVENNAKQLHQFMSLIISHRWSKGFTIEPIIRPTNDYDTQIMAGLKLLAT